jgi:hypothetical protein
MRKLKHAVGIAWPVAADLKHQLMLRAALPSAQMEYRVGDQHVVSGIESVVSLGNA